MISLIPQSRLYCCKSVSSTDSAINAGRCEKGQIGERGRDPSSCRHRSPQRRSRSLCGDAAVSPRTLASFQLLRIHSCRSARTVATWDRQPRQRRRAAFLLLTARTSPSPDPRGDDGGDGGGAWGAASDSEWGNQDDARGETERVQDGRSDGEEAGRSGASSALLKDQQGVF